MVMNLVLAFTGGSPINLSAALLLDFSRRIVGISGINAGVPLPATGAIAWWVVSLAEHRYSFETY